MDLDQLRHSVIETISADVELGATGQKFYCALPLEYPSGDSIVVYLSAVEGGIEVSDYGAGWENALRTNLRVGRLKRAGEEIARSLGVYLLKANVVALAQEDNLAEVVWRVGMASARIADAPTFQTADRTQGETDFVEKVDTALSSHHPVERQLELEAASGHTYTATFFVPSKDAVVEPWTPQSGWNRAFHMYAEFGDLSRANGYSRFAVVDDREVQPDEEVLSFLGQVSDVVKWSRREELMARLRE